MQIDISFGKSNRKNTTYNSQLTAKVQGSPQRLALAFAAAALGTGRPPEQHPVANTTTILIER